MNKRVVWFALVLMACGTCSQADTAVGYSNAFSIDNAAGDTRPKPPGATAISPYSPITHQLRGQLHAHSAPDKWYIGDPISDNEFAQKYKDFGYDFVALTNHHTVQGKPPISPEALDPPWSGWVPCCTELTYGGEARDGHLLCIGLSPGTGVDDIAFDGRSGSQPRDVVYNMTQRILKVHNKGGLALIAHPDSNCLGFDYRVTLDELDQICRSAMPDAVSIHHVTSMSEGTWEKLLHLLGTPVWGYAEDDYHPDVLSESWIGSTWVSVPANEGTPWSSTGGIRRSHR